MAKLKPQTPEDISRICAKVGVSPDRAMEAVRQIEEENARELDEAIREQEQRELLEQAAQAEQKAKGSRLDEGDQSK
ncbi:hypothetical protein N0V82_010289 [Gnomoniopsis sp. IMI 355080]|nr:hypothetical protein N0V82_010289 [Gnomoniopsis sp. IMI 355080]